MRRGDLFIHTTMKNQTSNGVFYTAFFITAVLTLGLSIGLNILWFGLYEIIKDYFEFSFTRASIAMGSLIWALAMVRVIPTILNKE